ncbi:hypothetical protein [Flavobacterium sp. HJJ]|uniref:hypothetical protein n=1 Tax=Flavobacterium sp. HJJ TaxID=2783792 RepID=UPI00188D883E|nr:hypothetical protein [Flavobacterium sp. HJJ]MBF4473727.1 hypothetical protein [Flavobacterium sp. HJJ]
MNKFEFKKDWFYKEEERKDTLNNTLNIPIGILTAIIAGLYFIITKFNYENCGGNILKFLFITIILFTSIFWLASIYYLLRSYNNLYDGYKYKAFPSAHFIEDEYNNLETYYNTYKDSLAPNITLDSLVEDNIEIILTNCLDTNIFNNDRKSAYLHDAKIQILNCILSLFVASIFYTFNYIYHEKNETHRILITNKDYMRNERQTPSPPPPPPRPQEPREIRENQQPTPRPTPPPRPRQ